MKHKTILAVATAVFLISTGLADAKKSNPEHLVELGNAIYKDLNLSKYENQSCMTCHHPSAGFADPENRLEPILFPVSEGSVLGLFGGRNAPSAAYAGFSPVFQYVNGLFVGGMFWDGRATGWDLGDPLAEQAQGPFLNSVEMALTDSAEVIRIIEASEYANKFLKVFGPDAFAVVDSAYDNVGRAIAAFERSSKVNKFCSKFDKFWAEQNKAVSNFGVDGQGNYVGIPAGFKSSCLTRQEAEGLALFNAVDKGNCAACHLTSNYTDSAGKVFPPLFTDFTYDNLGIPKNLRIAELAGSQPIDYGLGARTDDLLLLDPEISLVDVDGVSIAEFEAGKFKVPTLRNVARSAPYGHNGYFPTLQEITHFYNTRDLVSENWPEPEVDLNVNVAELGALGLTSSEEAAIVAFMCTLTD